jgi:phosphoglycolate phosphatase
MPKTLILFDIDGTLCHIRGAGREAKARTMIEFFGTDQGVREHVFGGKTDWQIMHELLTSYGRDTEQISTVINTFGTRMAEHMAEIIPTFPTEAVVGTHDLVNALRANPNVVLGIVTGNFAQTAPIKLQVCGFDPSWFVANAYGSESITRNTLPSLAIQRAREITGYDFQPHEVIVIGDTVADIDCARAAGAVAVAVLTGHEEPHLLKDAKPDYLLTDLTTFLEEVPLVHEPKNA